MKKLVRLTESDLHRIVENSVRQTLNELDWKTYVSAAQKDKNPERKKDFLQHATNVLKDKYPHRAFYSNTMEPGDDFAVFQTTGSFNPYLADKYGYMNYKDDYDGDHFQGRSEYHKSFGDRGVKGWGKTSADGFGGPFPYHDSSKINEPTDTENYGTLYTRNIGRGNDWEDATQEDDTPQWDWNNMSNDMEKFYTGKSKYTKGKGWN